MSAMSVVRAALMALWSVAAATAEVAVIDPVTGAKLASYGSMGADFGRPLPSSGGLRGRAVAAEPLTACQDIKAAPTKHAFALIAR